MAFNDRKKSDSPKTTHEELEVKHEELPSRVLGENSTKDDKFILSQVEAQDRLAQELKAHEIRPHGSVEEEPLIAELPVGTPEEKLVAIQAALDTPIEVEGGNLNPLAPGAALGILRKRIKAILAGKQFKQ